MTPALRQYPASLLACMSLACATSEAGPLGRPIVDTTASGVVRVMSPLPTGWLDSTTGWRLVEDLRLTGEEGTESELINPQSLAVDQWGRIYVVDRNPYIIKVYGPEGGLVRTIGREGTGPGEYRAGFIAVRGENLVIHDPAVSRTTVFDTSGTFLRSWSSSCCYYTQIHLDAEGLIYIPGMAGGPNPAFLPWIRYRLDGSLHDTARVPRSDREGTKSWTVRSGSGQSRSMFSTSVPLAPALRHAFTPRGGMVLGWSGEYSLVRSHTGLDSVRLFGRAWSPEPVTDSRKQELVDSMIKGWTTMDPAALRAVFNPGDIPSQKPAFEWIVVDDAGNTWVRTGATPAGEIRHDVFDSTGAWLGEIRFPRPFSQWGGQHFGRNAVVVTLEDDDGRPTIIRYRIVKP